MFLISFPYSNVIIMEYIVQ